MPPMALDDSRWREAESYLSCTSSGCRPTFWRTVALPLASCVILGNSLNPSEPVFLMCKMEMRGRLASEG